MQVCDLFINPSYRHQDLLSKFLDNLKLHQLEERLIYKNSKNSIYEIELYPNEKLILKLSKQDPKYSFSRKVSFYLRNFSKNYAKRAYDGSLLLEQANIPGIKPIAYLKFKQNFFLRNSCFIYHKVIADKSLLEVYYDTASTKEKLDLIRIMAVICKKLHKNKIVHGDLVLTNFLKTGDALREDSFTLIDTDGAYLNKYKSIFADISFLKSFRRGNLSDSEKYFLLQEFFERENVAREMKIVQFFTWLDTRPVSRFRRFCLGAFKR